MTALQELQAHLDAEVGPDPDAPAAVEAFRIDSAAKLNWALGKIAQAQQLQAEREQVYQEEVARITHWIDGARQTTEGGTAHLRSLIQDYLHRLELEGRKPSGSVPAGRAAMAHPGPQLVQSPTGTSALLAYAETQGLVKKSVDWATLKKRLHVGPTVQHYDEDGVRLDAPRTLDAAPRDSEGTLVPGVEVIQPAARLTITLTKGDSQ